MKTIDVLRLFGSKYKIGVALKVDPNQVYKWGETVPDLRQLQLEMLTAGKLQAEDRLKPWLKPSAKRARTRSKARSDAAATQMPAAKPQAVLTSSKALLRKGKYRPVTLAQILAAKAE